MGQLFAYIKLQTISVHLNKTHVEITLCFSSCHH